MADDRRQSLQGASSCEGCGRGQSRHESYKRGLNTKLHLAVDSHVLPVRVVVTEGTTADCTQASLLIEGLTAEYLLADKAYDSNEIIEQALAQGMEPVIPTKKNRIAKREYDKDLYQLGHKVENTFCTCEALARNATRF